MNLIVLLILTEHDIGGRGPPQHGRNLSATRLIGPASLQHGRGAA